MQDFSSRSRGHSNYDPTFVTHDLRKYRVIARLLVLPTVFSLGSKKGLPFRMVNGVLHFAIQWNHKRGIWPSRAKLVSAAFNPRISILFCAKMELKTLSLLGSWASAYERGYKVYTVKDACAATSVAGHESSFEHNFGMFSIPTNTGEILSAMQTSWACSGWIY